MFAFKLLPFAAGDCSAPQTKPALEILNLHVAFHSFSSLFCFSSFDKFGRLVWDFSGDVESANIKRHHTYQAKKHCFAGFCDESETRRN